MPRADLEFYLPQVVAHYLREDISELQEKQMESYLILVSEANHFLAHKLWFYLRSSLVSRENTLQLQRIFKLLTGIEVLVEKSQETLYLANSIGLLKLINNTNLGELLDEDQREIAKRLT